MGLEDDDRIVEAIYIGEDEVSKWLEEVHRTELSEQHPNTPIVLDEEQRQRLLDDTYQVSLIIEGDRNSTLNLGIL